MNIKDDFIRLEIEVDYAVATEDHNVRSHAASYQKLVRQQILAILGVDNSIERSLILVFIERMRLLNINNREGSIRLISMCAYTWILR